jgi:arsenical pump membrane protein
MLTFHSIVALLAVVGFILRPNGKLAPAALGAACAIEIALGASILPAVRGVAPVVIFIGAALTLSSMLERAGLADRTAALLAHGARGRLPALFALTCAACALLTSVVSLDGAVVLMVPVLVALRRTCGAPFTAFFTGVVVVANVASLALPQGNPTNLVVMARLGLSAGEFTAHMLLPGLAAALAAALLVAVVERRSLAGSFEPPERVGQPLSAPERTAVVALGIAAAAAWLAPLLELQPWLPFSGVVAVAALASRERPRTSIAIRLGAQVGALLLLMDVISVGLVAPAAGGLGPLLAVAAGVGAAAALTNNLPVSVSTASLVVGSSGYAAAIGLAAGSLALPRGSVATLLALEAAGAEAPELRPRVLTAIAAVAVTVATAVLWLTL